MPAAAEHAENEIRKEFTTSERVAIAEALRQEIGDRRGSNQHTEKEHPVNCPDANGKETREIVADLAGFDSSQEYRRAKAVVDKGCTALVEAK